MSRNAFPLIRPGGPSDAGLLAELGERTFADTFAGENKPEDMAAYLAAAFTPAQLAAELADPLAIFLLVEMDGVAIGYAKLYAGPAPAAVGGEKPLELVRFYVTREWHGRRIGEVLLRACLAEAGQRAYRTLWLGVWERNVRARAFYNKWGFREVGEHVFRLGSDLQTDILMERPVYLSHR